MSLNPRAAIVGTVVVLAAMAAACGDGASATVSPAPTGVSPRSSSGATISGRVNTPTSGGVVSGASADRWSTMGDSGITITIVGTSVTTVADGGGQFTLTDVPPGNVQLRFSGRGMEALLTITGVSAGDRIEISVTLNGSGARLDSDRRASSNTQVEVEGRVTAVNAGARTLQVAGQMVVVPATVMIRDGSRTLVFADIRIGDHVEIKGNREGNTITATEVKLEDDDEDDDEDEDDEDDEDDEVKGTVAAKAGTCPAISFTVGTTPVRADAATRFDDPCSHVVNGVRVEVKGTREAGGRILATRIELDD